MNRREYWDKKYVEYWKSKVDSANDVNAQEVTKGDYKTAGDLVAEEIFDLCSYCADEEILDFGCGFCRFYPYFRGREQIYWGVDISSAMIEEAKKKYLEIADNLFVSEGESLPFGDEKFDKVVCYGVFDACYQEKALEEMLRVCKNNGYIILTGKNDNYFADDEQARIAEEAARRKGHPNYFTDYVNMRKQLLNNGVQIVEERFFERRGDFGKNKYFNIMPDKFYEWAVVIKKRKNNRVKIGRISAKISKTIVRVRDDI